MFEVVAPSEIFSILSQSTISLLDYQAVLNEQVRKGKVDTEFQQKEIEPFWNSYKGALGLFQEFCRDLPNATDISSDLELSLKKFYNQLDQTELIVERAKADQEFGQQESELCLALNITVNSEMSNKSLLKQIKQAITHKLQRQLEAEAITPQTCLDSIEHLNAIFEAMIAIKTKSPENLEGQGVEKYRLLLSKVKEKLDMLINKLGAGFQQETNYIESFSDIVEQFTDDAEESGLTLQNEVTLDEHILQERKQRAKLLFKQGAASSALLQQKKKQHSPPTTPVNSNRRTVEFTDKAK